MKISITLETSDVNEAARTMQALANRLNDSAKVHVGFDPADTGNDHTVTVVRKKNKVVEVIDHSEDPQIVKPAEAVHTDARPDEKIQKKTPVKKAAPEKSGRSKKFIKAGYDQNGWGGQYPDCVVCHTKDRKRLAMGKCTRCYFVKPQDPPAAS